MDLTLIVVLVIALALFFDFTNGFHDTANAMATPIATGAMKPKVAVGLAAVLNLVGAFLSTAVATTISSGLIREGNGGVQISPTMIFAGLVGAVIWNMVTWLFGLPSSSSHALFGGLIGAAIVGAGFASVNYSVLLSKVVIPAVIAPVIAGFVAYAATRIVYAITRRYDGRPDGRDGFRHGQIFSSSLVALAHGTNDAQKTMGVITLVLISGGFLAGGSDVPFWVIVACAFAIALGTYTGGWRIIHTLGKGLTDVKPAQGFAAETSTAAAILASTHLGFALSTTQVASGSVIGSGLGRRGSRVRWKTARRIAMGWLLTLPASALVGALAAWVAHLGPVGVLLDTVLGAGVIAMIFIVSSRRRVTSASMAAGVAGMSEVAQSGRAVKIKKPKQPKQPKQPKKPRKPKKSQKPKKPGKLQDLKKATKPKTTTKGKKPKNSMSAELDPVQPPTKDKKKSSA